MSTVKKSELVVDESEGLMVRYAKKIGELEDRARKLQKITNGKDITEYKDAIAEILYLCNKIRLQGDRIHNSLEIGSMKQLTFDAFAGIDKPCFILPENRDFFTRNGMLGFYPNEDGEEDHSDLRTQGRRKLTPFNSGAELVDAMLNDVIKETEDGKDVLLVRSDFASRKIVCKLGKKKGSGESNFLKVYNSCPNSPTHEMIKERSDRCFYLNDLLLFFLTYYKFIFHDMITGNWMIGDNHDSRLQRRLIFSKTKKIVTEEDMKRNEVVLPTPYEDAYVSLKVRFDKAKKRDDFYNDKELLYSIIGFCKTLSNNRNIQCLLNEM